MNQKVNVQLDALSAYARTADEIAGGLAAVRYRLLAAGVTSDAFGLLPESQEAAEVYEERTDAGLEVLAAGNDGFAQIADDVRQVRRNYEASDEFSASLTRGPGS